MQASLAAAASAAAASAAAVSLGTGPGRYQASHQLLNDVLHLYGRHKDQLEKMRTMQKAVMLQPQKVPTHITYQLPYIRTTMAMIIIHARTCTHMNTHWSMLMHNCSLTHMHHVHASYTLLSPALMQTRQCTTGRNTYAHIDTTQGSHFSVLNLLLFFFSGAL